MKDNQGQELAVGDIVKSMAHSDIDRYEIIACHDNGQTVTVKEVGYSSTQVCHRESLIKVGHVSSKTRDDKLTERTIKIIESGGRIFLRHITKHRGGGPFSYLGHWTNIAAGPDQAHWVNRDCALEIFNLKWAFALAKLYNCKVVVFYPKR